MNIIEAREAAMAGKTVIGPNGVEFIARDFSDDYEGDWINEMVFGEWSIKQEPVVFSADVLESKLDKGTLLLNEQSLSQFIGKRVKVTVECVE